MDRIVYDSIVKQAIISSIEKEELLIKKYDNFNNSIEDDDFNELLVEFNETSKEHINLLKSKLQKLVL